MPFLLISFIIIQSYYYTTLWEDYHACRTKNTKKKEDGAAAAEAEVDNERLYLRLDRPFFYLILDTRQQFPLFMGVLMAVR